MQLKLSEVQLNIIMCLIPFMVVVNTLADYDKATIMERKSFVVQTPVRTCLAGI